MIQFFPSWSENVKVLQKWQSQFFQALFFGVFFNLSNKDLSILAEKLCISLPSAGASQGPCPGHLCSCLHSVSRALPFPAGLWPNPALLPPQLRSMLRPSPPACFLAPAALCLTLPAALLQSLDAPVALHIFCKSHPQTFPGPAKVSSLLHPSPCASPASSSSQQMKGTGKPTSSIPWHGDFGQASASPADPFGALLDIQTDTGPALVLVFY